MLDCIVLGDSIAVGVGQARHGCKIVAETGINSERYVQMLDIVRAARTAIISLGVNDSDDIDTEANLRRLRAAVRASTVYWMLVGTNPRSRDAVRRVAAAYRDRLIDVAPLAGPDHIHPGRDGYAWLASVTLGSNGGTLAAQPLTYHHAPPPQWTKQPYPGVRLTPAPPPSRP